MLGVRIGDRGLGLPQIVDGDGCAVVLSQYRLELGHPPHGDTPERLAPFLLVTNFPVHSMGFLVVWTRNYIRNKKDTHSDTPFPQNVPPITLY